MKTIVYQAFTGEMPLWLNQCIETVKHWARKNKFDYQFIDDQMLDYVPQWYRDKVGEKIALIADLARLEMAKEFLLNGYERTIWMDADVIIFNDEKFVIDITGDFAFCKEVWFDLSPEKKLMCLYNITNGVTVFTNSNFLDFFIYACKQLIKNSQKNSIPFEINIRFLTMLYKHLKYPLLANVGQFSPLILDSIVNNRDMLLKAYMQHFGSPNYASNLCLSFRNKTHSGISINDEIFGKVIEILLESKGEVINKYFAI